MHVSILVLKGFMMRSVSFKYLRQADSLLSNNGIRLSSKRLRRCAYLDVHQSSYKLYELYGFYKKVINSDAANNQMIAIVVVLVLISASLLFLITL